MSVRGPRATTALARFLSGSSTSAAPRATRQARTASSSPTSEASSSKAAARSAKSVVETGRGARRQALAVGGFVFLPDLGVQSEFLTHAWGEVLRRSEYRTSFAELGEEVGSCPLNVRMGVSKCCAVPLRRRRPGTRHVRRGPD